MIGEAQPDFQLSLSDSAITINQGSRRRIGITITPIGHFDSKVVVNVSRIPSWVTVDFKPSNEVTPSSGRSTTINLVLDVSQSAAPGKCTLQLDAVSGAISKPSEIHLRIQNPRRYVLAAGIAAILLSAIPLISLARLPITIERLFPLLLVLVYLAGGVLAFPPRTRDLGLGLILLAAAAYYVLLSNRWATRRFFLTWDDVLVAFVNIFLAAMVVLAKPEWRPRIFRAIRRWLRLD